MPHTTLHAAESHGCHVWHDVSPGSRAAEKRVVGGRVGSSATVYAGGVPLSAGIYKSSNLAFRTSCLKRVQRKTEAAMVGHPTQPLHPTRGRSLARRFRGSCIATLRVALLGRLGRAPGERQNVRLSEKRAWPRRPMGLDVI
jgi:hypothetical protein